jgi:hypothetical protein
VDSYSEVICTLKPYLQGFERKLAAMELSRLTGTEIAVMEPDSRRPCSVPSLRTAPELAERLTYWETVSNPSDLLTGSNWTRQLRREATVNLVRNGVQLAQIREALPFNGTIPVPNRRILRYGPHGMHDYRGKFFPQLVRSLLNIAGLQQGSVVLDPMCGSGTSMVEASLMGCSGVGVDFNPLSVFVSRGKCDVLASDPDEVARAYEAIRDSLLCRHANGHSTELTYLNALPKCDREYLQAWFSRQVLADLDRIAVVVGRVADQSVRRLFLVCLSNVLRRVSWQKDDDLRVRRQDPELDDVDAIAEYLAETGRTVRTVLAFLYESRGVPLGAVRIVDGDAKRLPSALPWLNGLVDAVVFSPPYATALPYLDTDRLSLCYLGLLSRPEHRERDYGMIGNREVTERRRQLYWEEYLAQKRMLPEGVVATIDRVDRLNKDTEVGFRRRNLPALLARYFLDMREVLANVVTMLRPGAPVFIVVGNNHTIAGGQRVDIETDRLIGDIGQSVGLGLETIVPMEMLVSRDIFKKNAVASESILFFRRAP